MIISISALFKRHRSIHRDAVVYARRLQPPLRILGEEHILTHGPCLVTPNHYSHPGFKSWWVVLAVNSAVKVDVHWVMTGAWTYPEHSFGERVITPLTRWGFKRLAQTYGFTNMPAMPPNPDETIERAASVRKVLQVMREQPDAMIGLAPEGGDTPGGILQMPPAGVGRFISHLVRDGRPVLPVGVYEEEGALFASFGPAYRLDIPAGLSASEREARVARRVMEAIARQLPEHLRGEFCVRDFGKGTGNGFSGPI